MFMGTHQNQIDPKNRMIIPAKFRDELGYKCVLTFGIDSCLYIYKMEDWERFAEKIKELPLSDEDARTFIRHFFGNATECEIDRQGRITLPADHRKYAGIERELVTVGAMDKLEIWARERYGAAENSSMTPSEVARKMVQYGI